MDESRKIETIDFATFEELLAAYPDVVPAKLSALDKQRYEQIPDAIAKQEKPKDLSKEQLTTLVDWKLAHGKFRPTLKGLVQQNPEDQVRSFTGVGIMAYSTRKGELVKESFKTLTELRGIGPATASLILSVYDPEAAPFFSDELFRWCFYEEDRGKGWDRGIKYNVKEYQQLFEKVQELRDRFRKDYQREIAAVEIEKVAYVLGKRKDEASSGATKDSEKPNSKRKAAADDQAPSKSMKAMKSTSISKPQDESPVELKGGSRRSDRVAKK